MRQISWLPTFLASASLALPLLAQAEEAPAADVDGGAPIIVTGTRSAPRRTVADSPVPIDVKGWQEFKATGRTGHVPTRSRPWQYQLRGAFAYRWNFQPILALDRDVQRGE